MNEKITKTFPRLGTQINKELSTQYRSHIFAHLFRLQLVYMYVYLISDSITHLSSLETTLMLQVHHPYIHAYTYTIHTYILYIIYTHNLFYTCPLVIIHIYIMNYLGMMHVENGILKTLFLHSGHYRPSETHLYKFLHLIVDELQLPMDEAVVSLQSEIAFISDEYSNSYLLSIYLSI